MFVFWIIAALCLIFSLLIIVITLLKNYDDNDTQAEFTADIYQLRLNEIDADIENGLLSPSDAKNVKQEMRLALLNQTKEKQISVINNDGKPSTMTVIIILITIPVFVIGLYQHLGQPELITQATLLSKFNNANSQEEKMRSIEEMLTQLEQRLINQPDDSDGWLMLTNSYVALKRYPDALKAIDNLYRLGGNDPTVLLRYADILSRVNDGLFTGRPTRLINEALKIDPENSDGLWLAGLAANERGDTDNAVKYWKLLLPKLEEGSEAQQKIKKSIDIALGNTDVSENNIALNIIVKLSETLINETNDDDTVFVYAKALKGSPMPLAIVRKNVSDLPLNIMLNDTLAMIATHKLSNHTKVQLIARISKSGSASPHSGDLIGTIDSISTDTRDTLQLVINQKIP